MRVGDPIQVAQECLNRGNASLFKTFPKAIKAIIEERLWDGRTNKAGKPFKSFEAFVRHPLWHGLEINGIERLVEFCREDQEAVAAIRAEIPELNKPGAPEGSTNNPTGNNQHVKQDKVDNVNIIQSKPKGGNQQTYLISRLKRDAPEVAQDLIDGKYPSVRQAAIAAGIVKVKTPFQHILTNLKKLDRHELIDLAARVDEILKTTNQRR